MIRVTILDLVVYQKFGYTFPRDEENFSLLKKNFIVELVSIKYNEN